jgi:hypothetical protein
MFLGIGITVLVGTTSIISLGVWVVNRNDKWQGMHLVSTTLSQAQDE